MTFLAAVVVASFVAAPKEEPKDAREALQGEWKLTRFAKLSREAPAKELEDGKVVVKGDKLTFTLAERDTEMTFTLDPKADPPAIDLSARKPGQAIRGIYKLETDKLTICFGIEDSPRPTEFKTGRNDSIMVLERVKK